MYSVLPPLTKQANWFTDLGKRIYNASHIEDLPGAPDSFKQLNAVAEEAGELNRQGMLRKLFGNIADREGVHLQDRLLGGLGGGGVSVVADDQLREHDGSLQDWGTRLAALLGGTYGGGKALNASNNVMRRYIAETAPLRGYDPGDVVNNKSIGQKIKEFFDFGIRGKQRTDLDDMFNSRVDYLKNQQYHRNAMERDMALAKAKDTYLGNKMRAEFLRRYLGIHRSGSGDMLMRRADGTYGLNQEVFKPGTDEYNHLISRPFHFKGMQSRDSIAPYSENTSESLFDNFLGSHDQRMVGDSRRVRGGRAQAYEVGDVWNFAKDPNETDIGKYLMGIAKTSPLRWSEYLGRDLSDATHQSLKQISGGTVGSRLKSMLMRQIMEKYFRHHSPVFRQQFDVMFPEKERLVRRMIGENIDPRDQPMVQAIKKLRILEPDVDTQTT